MKVEYFLYTMGSKPKHTIESINNAIIHRGIRCTSDVYRSAKKHDFLCVMGHTWSTTVNSVVNAKTGCRTCIGLNQRHKIEYIKQFAIDNGFECLSNTYTGIDNLLRWKCKSNHEWENSFTHIKDGQRCPTCRNSIGETSAMITIIDFLPTEHENDEIKFNARKSEVPELGCLELDIYILKYRLAFEYDGIQHTEFKSIFFKNEKEFQKRLEDDKKKR
jgi:hypothetical protein